MNTINLGNENLRTLPRDNSSSTSTPSAAKNGSSTIASGVSVYDNYGLSEGFSHNLNSADKVTLSPIGLMLSEAQTLAESNRETWSDPSKIFGHEVKFDGVFKEVQSEDGGLVFRKFNADYLDQIQSAPDALVLYEQINKQDKHGIIVTTTSDVDKITFNLREIAAQDRYNSILDLADKKSAVSEATKNFNATLSEEHPGLDGVTLEFSTKESEIILAEGKENGLKRLSRNSLKLGVLSKVVSGQS